MGPSQDRSWPELRPVLASCPQAPPHRPHSSRLPDLAYSCPWAIRPIFLLKGPSGAQVRRLNRGRPLPALALLTPSCSTRSRTGATPTSRFAATTSTEARKGGFPMPRRSEPVSADGCGRRATIAMPDGGIYDLCRERVPADDGALDERLGRASYTDRPARRGAGAAPRTRGARDQDAHFSDGSRHRDPGECAARSRADSAQGSSRGREEDDGGRARAGRRKK